MSNKGQAYAYRSEVVLQHHLHGLFGAMKPPEPKGVDPSEKVRGDVLGLPFTVAVRSSLTLDLSGALREVQREAEAEANDVYVAILKRRDEPPEQSYAVTTLSVWLDVMARLYPESVTSPPFAQAGL